MSAASQDWPSRMLLAMLREDEGSFRQLMGAGEDPPALAALADRHGLGPYIGSLCLSKASATMPEDLRAWMEERRRKTIYDNMLLMAQARPLLGLMRERGIVPILLKGCALMGRVYRHPGARSLTDIDLLVRPEQADEAYRLIEDGGLRSEPGSQRAPRRAAFVRNGPDQAGVDIHWDLSQRYRFQADLEGVWDRSIEFDFEGISVRRLAPTDEFLYLSLHHASHYFGVSLKWLVDLRELLRRDPPEPDELAARAEAWGGVSGLHFALRYLRRVYPSLEFPGEMELAVASPLRDWLARPFLSRDPLLLVTPRRRGAARLAMGLLFVDSPLDMARLGWVTLVARREADCRPQPPPPMVVRRL